MAKKPVPAPSPEQLKATVKVDFQTKVAEHKQAIANIVREASDELESTEGDHTNIHGAILHLRLVALEEKVFGKPFELPSAPVEAETNPTTKE